jgi:hypothetical protein
LILVKAKTAVFSHPVSMLVTRRQASSGILAAAAVTAATSGVAAQGATPMQLPAPRAQGGKPLIEALKLRRSTREYADRALPPQVLSDLLWAAFGINRPSGDRTAPYWRHIMVIDVYAAIADGLWFYEPKDHSLQRRSSADIRAATGLQDFVATAPLNLVYVAHGERMHDVAPEERRLYACVDAGFYRAERLPVLRLRGSRDRFSGSRRYQKTCANNAARRRAIRDICANRRISEGVTGGAPEMHDA